MKRTHGNDYLEFPAGADGSFPNDRVARREIVLGHDTVNTCNIAFGDVNGDGLDEIAIPITIGERDTVRLYRGSGELLWDNPGVQLYHAHYGDPDPPKGGMSHMWHRSKHRHVLTEIVDFDGDGRLEVVVGDGPIYVLDAATGDQKALFDLGGRVPLWNVVHDPARGHKLIVATADDRERGPRAVALDPEGAPLWSIPTPGRGFCDCMHHGDLDLDGRPEIGFSVEEAREFWLVDCDGNVRWKKNVPADFGDDLHVDDFTIDQVLPSDRMDGKQLALVTGPNLLDKDGNVIWSAAHHYDHAQKVLTQDLQPERPGHEVYTVESFVRRAHLMDCDGEPIWTYDNFTIVREGYESGIAGRGRAIGRLTTAGDFINWSGHGKTEIVQSEMGMTDKRWQKQIPHEHMRWFMHVLDRDGQPVTIFPIDDSPMCARAANVTDSPTDDIVMVGHYDSRIHIFSSRG